MVIKTHIALASIHVLLLDQISIKITYLNGGFEEEIYMNQCDGFVVSGQEAKIWNFGEVLVRLKIGT